MYAGRHKYLTQLQRGQGERSKCDVRFLGATTSRTVQVIIYSFYTNSFSPLCTLMNKELTILSYFAYWYYKCLIWISFVIRQLSFVIDPKIHFTAYSRDRFCDQKSQFVQTSRKRCNKKLVQRRLHAQDPRTSYHDVVISRLSFPPRPIQVIVGRLRVRISNLAKATCHHVKTESTVLILL